MTDITVSTVNAQRINEAFARQARYAVEVRQARQSSEEVRQAEAANRVSQLDAEQRLRDLQQEDALLRLAQFSQNDIDLAFETDQSLPRGALLDVIA